MNEAKLKIKLQEVDWNKLLLLDDCNERYNAIVDNFKLCYENSTYTFKSKQQKKLPIKKWMTADLFNLARERDKALKRWKHCCSSL
jgi:protoheme ferro-lyase